MTNLLFLIADQFRAQCVDPDGDPVATPHLDALAADGVRCDTAFSSYPVCSPHRAMLISGQTPWENGVWTNVNSANNEHGVGLRTGASSWAQAMSDAGMHTGWIGKWHLEPPTAQDEIWGEGRRGDGKVWDAWSPPDRRFGFRTWYSYGCCDQHLSPHYWDTHGGREDVIEVDQWSASHETDRAIEILGDMSRADEPFALAVSWNPPHTPYEQLPNGVDPALAAQGGAALLNRPNIPDHVREEAERVAPQYFTAVQEIDAQVGRLVATLEELGVREDTVVVFTSDHGDQLGSHGRFGKNVPLEESMRIPLIISQPGRVPTGQGPAMLGSLDLAPTLLGLVGLGDQVPAAMVGEDLSSEVLGSEPAAVGPATADPAAADPAVGRVVPFFHDEPDPEGLTQRGVRTATHMWVLNEQQGRRWSVCHDLEADPYQLDPVDDPALDLQLARATHRVLLALDAPWSALEQHIDELTAA